MPRSTSEFDREIELLFEHMLLDSALDIGAGEGKFGRLLQRIRPQTRRIGVEIDPQYAAQFNLNELYHELLIQDATLLMSDVDKTYDAVMMGDVIEHLPKSAGVDLLHFLVYRTRVIVLKFPLQMPQNAWQGHRSEAHRSVWSARDFSPFDHLFFQRDGICLAIVRGYLNHAIEWLPQQFVRALGYESCRAYYDQSPDRWNLADLETLRRELMLADIRSVIAPGERFILIDEDQSGLLSHFPDQAVPYVEKHGQYHGMPADDRQAVAELERLGGAGARYVVLLRQSAWALDHYPSLAGRFPATSSRLKNERLAIFEL